MIKVFWLVFITVKNPVLIIGGQIINKKIDVTIGPNGFWANIDIAGLRLI